MEPITFIVTALAAGAAAGLTASAENAIKEAYAGIKALIQRKFGGVDLAVLESKPESATRRGVVAEELTEAGAAQDQELLQAAERLMQLIQQRAPQVGQVIGVIVIRHQAVVVLGGAVNREYQHQYEKGIKYCNSGSPIEFHALD